MSPTATATVSITTMKNLSYLAVFLATTKALGFVPETLTLFVVLMLFDVLTGIYRTYLIEGGHAIKSRIGIRGVVSKMMLLVLVFSVAITARILGFNAEDYVNGVIMVLALGELYSIVGNIHSARTGRPKSEFDAVTFILKKIRKGIDKYMEL